MYVFQIGVLVETKHSLQGVATIWFIVWNVTMNKLILKLQRWTIFQDGIDTVIDWHVFALEHTDLSKIIANISTVQMLFFL